MNASILPRANNATNKETQQFSFVVIYSSPEWEVLVKANRVYVRSSTLFTSNMQIFQKKVRTSLIQVKGTSKDSDKYPVSPELIVSLQIIMINPAKFHPFYSMRPSLCDFNIFVLYRPFLSCVCVIIIFYPQQALFVFVVIGSAVFQIIQSVWMSGP